MRWLGLAVFLTYRMLRTLTKVVSGLVAALVGGALAAAATEGLPIQFSDRTALISFVCACVLSFAAFVLVWNRLAVRLNSTWTPERSERWSVRLGLPPGALDADAGERPSASTVAARTLALPALPGVVRIAARILAAAIVVAAVAGGIELARVLAAINRTGACMEKGGWWNDDERRCYYATERCVDHPDAVQVTPPTDSGLTCYVPM
ncbi:MAG: hypothetical protein ACJ790_00145 [Myxococcaceae bacterium]